MGVKVLFIGNYTDDETYELITKKGIRDLSQAGRLFQKRLIDSLTDQTDEFRAISVLPANHEIVLPRYITSMKRQIEVISVINRSAASIINTMRRICNLIINECGKDTVILMYAVNPIILIPFLRLKKKYHLSLVTVCSELPQFRRYEKTIKNEIKRNILKYFNCQFDKYIIFAEEMRDYLPKEKPYMVLEGYAPETIQSPQIREKNIAMYAGGLAEDNGIRMMIEAAHMSKLIDELWICGIGAALDYVKSHVDNKVRYLGSLTNEKVVNYEKQAKILLNVRDPKSELTRFSFPSKILEYMASGGIVLSSNLPGIPQEYYQHIVSLKDYSPEELAYRMDKIFEMSDPEFLSASKAASDFISRKTAEKRCCEIIEFITNT